MDIEQYSDNYPIYYTGEIPELIKKYIKSNRKASIIDCGCGDGGLLYSLKKEGFLKNKDVYAIDLSKNRLKHIKSIDGSFITHVDNAEELKNIKDGSIDFYISTQVIEHVDQEKMLKNANRVMKKGGTAYISTVYKRWFGWYFYRNHGKWVIDPTHVREYSQDSELLEDVEKFGFKVIENRKKQIWFPVMGYVAKLLSIKDRRVFENKVMRSFRSLAIPIPGYYTWELVLVKKIGYDCQPLSFSGS